MSQAVQSNTARTAAVRATDQARSRNAQPGVYADGVKSLLLRKIRKAEHELVQLKMDYCRFIFGLSFGALVVSNGKLYVVDQVETESMQLLDSGDWSRPSLQARPVDALAVSKKQLSAPVQLAPDWEIFRPADRTARV